MNTKPEEEEGFDGVCSLCGTDCGGVSQLFDENAKLRAVLRDILNSDMAMREEDEGRTSPALQAARSALGKSSSAPEPLPGQKNASTGRTGAREGI